MALTPMMRQYLEIKEQNKDCLLFFRLGDFYEMFFEDAVTASRELEITLTGKDCGLEERAPMCGVPYHAAEGYIQRLIEKGYKVAICEQLEDPSQAKGIVERGIVRIITPGTVADGAMLKENEDSYILSLYMQDSRYGAAYADVSTGKFFVEEGEQISLNNLLARVAPKEILYDRENAALDALLKSSNASFYCTPYEAWPYLPANAEKLLRQHFGVMSLDAFALRADSLEVPAAGALLQYLLDTQKNALKHIKKLTKTSGGAYMVIDPFTHRNLELTETMREKAKRGSLLGLLDKTRTAMGGRLLKHYIEQPLLDRQAIQGRLDAVEELKNDLYLRSTLRASLEEIYDIERLLSRISYGSLDARDAVAIRSSLRPLPEIRAQLTAAKSPLLQELGGRIDCLTELCAFLEESIADTPPMGLREGGFIRPGFHAEVDKLREAKTSGKDWLASLEKREREQTGIKNLRIGYNKVFGYYIEVTKANQALVPYRYTRRQTLTGSERYITQELKELEDMLLSSEDKCNKLEYQLFQTVREKLEQHMEAMQENANCIAVADALQSFAQAAYDYNYVKPQIREDGTLKIVGGRHPVVERAARQDFVPNDVYMDAKDDKLLIITGPNMAGKSTFMRQVGLIVLMAQMGSFVPAESAKIGIVDRVFTRVGASDDLASGQSTFMVEMNELASILNNATKKSLLILDEIGRGTSTLDGLSIAWATIEYILGEKGIGAKTLFATHYHELTALERMIPGVRNYSVGVKEFHREILFLHKIVRGGADKSFGIDVAKLAGLPEALISRARALLSLLEEQSSTDLAGIDLSRADTQAENQRTEQEEHVLSALRALDINSLTPLEALSLLNDFRQKILEDN